MTADVLEFETFSGGKVWLNLSGSYRILRVPTREELSDLIAEFRCRQWEWLKDCVCQWEEKHGLINGLAASKVKIAKKTAGEEGAIALNLAKIAAEGVPDAAWDILKDVSPLPKSAPSTRIVNATREQQCAFMLAAMGNSLQYAENLFRPGYKEALVYSWLDTAFATYTDPKAFLEALFAQAVIERAPRDVATRNQNKNMRRPLLDMFLLWLSQYGIMLFPLMQQPFVGDTRGFEDWLISPEQKATFAAIGAAYENKAKQRHAKWAARNTTIFRMLTTASTLRTAEDLSLEMFEAAYAAMDKMLEKTLTDRLHLIYRVLRDSLGRRELPTFKPIRRVAPKLKTPFAWAWLSTKGHPRILFPRMLEGDYEPLPHICAWAERFSKIIAKLPVKNVSNTVTTYQWFLCWLISSGFQVFSLAELEREHINDIKPLASSSCFRAILSRADMSRESANAHIMRLAWAFEAMIEEDKLSISNPVSVRFDSFKLQVTRGKTPRRPMSRDLMSYLRELNKRDNYALSRNYPSHQRTMLNASGQYEAVWFPAFAVIVDLLLQLPLRGFQARFLDSGEGDEEVVAVENSHLALKQNSLSTATPGRREGLFYLFEGKDGSQTLGLHINTNKTGVDRVSGYEIAWCSPDLRDALNMLREWQINWNPVARSVSCIEKSDFEQAKNRDMLESLKTTYALFRDPSDAQGWPISRDKLFDYWSLLLARAEDELAAQGQKIRLTVEKEISKGPNKRPVTKRLAAYDIHTLRVSGISALIEAGMPPDMVQQVAGHATVVMTLYYNKIKASRLNETLSHALNQLSTSLDNIDGMAEADFDRLSKYLLNRRSPEDAIGKTLLSERIGHGDGSVEVTVHGICPGGECSTGGEFQNQAVGYGPVPRPLACSLCRYRLTGPRFLTGLVLNANRLMHELRSKGKEIATLNEERERLADQGQPIHIVKAKIEALYRETDIVGAEWAAEVQYVHAAERLFEDFLADTGGINPEMPVLVTGQDGATLESRLENHSEFALLQSLAEGSQVWPGFKPTAALDDHREFLNEVLAASDINPFLLKLRGEVREKAATLLGRAITAWVPDDRLDNLREGVEQLENYPAISAFLGKLREQALTLGTIDESKLASHQLDNPNGILS